MSLQNSQEIADVKMFIAKGADGVGIEKIEKTATVGLVDTYTITYTDGNISTFEVTNGSGGSAGTTTYDPTVSGLASDTVQGAIDEVAGELSVAQTDISNLDDVKIDTDSGTFTDASSNTYTGQTVDMISYDNTNNQLLMKVNGADTVIPFKRGDDEPVLLWTNPNPSSSFSAQTVPLDLSKYKGVTIKWAGSTQSNTYLTWGSFNVGDVVTVPTSPTAPILGGGTYGTSSSGLAVYRALTITTAGIDFAGTGVAGTNHGAGYAIPREIYGLPCRIRPEQT